MKKTFITLIICSFFLSCSSGDKSTTSKENNNGFNYSKKNSYFKNKKNKNKQNGHHEGCNAPCCAEE